MIAHLFHSKTRDVSLHAQHYLQGLLSQIPRKNMERMGEAIPEAKHENLQNFLSDSPWESGPVWQWICQRADQHLGGGPDSMLAIDESAQSKKGLQSVGVGRQYNGRLGKTDNCQVGVYAALAQGTRATLVGARLFLPKEWVNDPERCRKVGVPEREIRERSKLDLARELVSEAVAHQLRFKWVGIDSFYGRDQGLLCWLEDQGHGVVADVSCDQMAWEHEPKAERRPAPEAGGARRVDALAAPWRQKKKAGTKVTLRVGENGPVRVRIWARRVWFWPAGEKKARQWWLVVREEQDGKCKYTLCNAPSDTSLERLAGLQGQRHFIERSFEDGKSHLGMGQYQVRKWRAWQHHKALVGLAQLFVLAERVEHRVKSPLLSSRDVVEMLHWYFQSQRTGKEVEMAIRKRHTRRAKLAAAALRRAEKKPKNGSRKVPK
jgi:SRSO17 transposase